MLTKKAISDATYAIPIYGSLELCVSPTYGWHVRMTDGAIFAHESHLTPTMVRRIMAGAREYRAGKVA